MGSELFFRLIPSDKNNSDPIFPNQTKMKLVERRHFYSIGSFFPPSIVAGFTKTSLDGREVIKDIQLALKDSINSDIKVAFMHQRHSSGVNFINRGGLYEGDALFTKQKNVVLVVKTADCLPLFFYDKKNDSIGIVHLGWRSAKEGILDNININLSSSRTVAGVALRKCCFEVTTEFLRHDRISPFVEGKNAGEFRFDPIAFSKAALTAKGLEDSNFKDLNMCTLCHNLNFFSYRRDKTKNRMLSFIFKK